MLTSADLAYMRTTQQAALPDACNIYHVSGTTTNDIGETVPAYPGEPDLRNEPCRYLELSGQDLINAQAVDERITAELTLSVSAEVRQDSKIELLGRTWHVSRVWTEHAWSTALRVWVRKENA